MASIKRVTQQLFDQLQQRADKTSNSFKCRSALGSLVFPCQIGPFRQRQKADAPAVPSDLASKKKRAVIIRSNSSDEDITGSAPPQVTVSHGAEKPVSSTVETTINQRDCNESSNAQTSAAVPKKRRVILSDSSSDDDSIDLLAFSSSESSVQMLSDDGDFINDESSSSCSSSFGRSPIEHKRNPDKPKMKRKQLPPCVRCQEMDGDRFTCSECHRTYHEDCGGPGPSCTLCSECAAALGIDPTQLSDSGSDSEADSITSSSGSSGSSSSECSDADYECAVCHENDCGYIKSCRSCGKRAHESCGGPGPMHRKCDTCMKTSNRMLPKRGSSKVVELGSNSSSECSSLDDGGSASDGSNSDVCVVCGESDGEIRICKICGRFLHELCGGPGPCHKLCDSCTATLGKSRSKKGRHGMVEL